MDAQANRDLHLVGSDVRDAGTGAQTSDVIDREGAYDLSLLADDVQNVLVLDAFVAAEIDQAPASRKERNDAASVRTVIVRLDLRTGEQPAEDRQNDDEVVDHADRHCRLAGGPLMDLHSLDRSVPPVLRAQGRRGRLVVEHHLGKESLFLAGAVHGLHSSLLEEALGFVEFVASFGLACELDSVLHDRDGLHVWIVDRIGFLVREAQTGRLGRGEVSVFGSDQAILCLCEARACRSDVIDLAEAEIRGQRREQRTTENESDEDQEAILPEEACLEDLTLDQVVDGRDAETDSERHDVAADIGHAVGVGVAGANDVSDQQCHEAADHFRDPQPLVDLAEATSFLFEQSAGVGPDLGAEPVADCCDQEDAAHRRHADEDVEEECCSGHIHLRGGVDPPR